MYNKGAQADCSLSDVGSKNADDARLYFMIWYWESAICYLLSRMLKELFLAFIKTSKNQWNTAAIGTGIKAVGLWKALCQGGFVHNASTALSQNSEFLTKTNVRKVQQLHGCMENVLFLKWKGCFYSLKRRYCPVMILNVHPYLAHTVKQRPRGRRDCESLVSHKFTINSHHRRMTANSTLFGAAAETVWTVCWTELLRLWALREMQGKCCTAI